jgi:hypothetical protein
VVGKVCVGYLSHPRGLVERVPFSVTIMLASAGKRTITCRRTIPAHRLAHRDGFIAGTGATGVESAGGIITSPETLPGPVSLSRQDRTDILFGHDSSRLN